MTWVTDAVVARDDVRNGTVASSATVVHRRSTCNPRSGDPASSGPDALADDPGEDPGGAA